MLEHFHKLKIPLAKTSKIFVSLFSAIAHSFELLQESIHTTVLQQFIKSQSDIELFAQDRSIEKIKDEQYEQYHYRVRNAYQFLRHSATKKGLENIIDQVIKKKFTLRELYQEDFILGNPLEKLGMNTILQSSQSLYFFIVDFEDPLTVYEKHYLQELIEYYKPAHIGFRIDAQVLDDWILGDPTEKLGTHTYLGA
ncbi:MAG: hypothetical protein ACRCWI_08420 [Brevinema sp.]